MAFCTWSFRGGTAGTCWPGDYPNTLEVGICVEALEEAFSNGKPEVFNTDQGSQFTSAAFTGALLERGIQVSPDEYGTFGMDGKGRYLDNIIVESFRGRMAEHQMCT
jgi:transposase InsO family protein